MTIEKKIKKLGFEQTALEIFHTTYSSNAVYKNYCDNFINNPFEVTKLNHIPFLPVEAFKHHKVIADGLDAETIFESSGTSDSKVKSRHYVSDLTLYHESLLQCFRAFIGEPADICIIALLPSYLERNNASLVHMAKELMNHSTHPKNGFYLDDFDLLRSVLEDLRGARQPTVLIGVSFALLDLAEYEFSSFDELTVIETGGMKGKRKELIRAEVIERIKGRLNCGKVYSEYGMTELLSQAYAGEDGIFKTPSWMKVLIREINDPLSYLEKEKTGGINVIDLANINSCPFIATQDLGRLKEDGFEVLGRFDNSDLRGCNLMWS